MSRNFISLGIAAILCLLASVSHALPFADSVVSFTPGSDFGVDDDESDGTYAGKSGEGVFDPLAVSRLDGVVLALGGTADTPGAITLRFTQGEVIDGAGPDLRLYDTFSFADGFRLDGSLDGSSFSHIFTFAGDLGKFNCSLSSPCIADVDLSGSGLSALSYLRIATAGSSGQGFPAGYTLDAVEALHFNASPVPEPGTFALFGTGLGVLAAARRRVIARAGES